MTDKHNREMDFEVFQSGAHSENLFVYNGYYGYQWQPLLCVLWTFTMATLDIMVCTNVSGNEPKCSCVLRVFFCWNRLGHVRRYVKLG